MDNVRCIECKVWLPAPIEWDMVSEYEVEILSDDFICQTCAEKIDECKVVGGDYVDC